MSAYSQALAKPRRSLLAFGGTGCTFGDKWTISGSVDCVTGGSGAPARKSASSPILTVKADVRVRAERAMSRHREP